MLAKNEKIYEDMIDILGEYKKCIPSKVVSLKEHIPGSDITEDRAYITTLVGGDYLSVAQAHCAQYIWRTSELAMHRLDGILPVAEDWHAKVCLLEVLIDGFLIHNYRTPSAHNAGPLHAPKNQFQVNFNIWW